MRRREFITLLGATAVSWPLVARAQQRSVHIGILLLGPAVPPKELTITSELARLGYVEGRNVSYEIRGANGDLGRLPTLTRELVATKPDVLVSASEIAADVLAKATPDIPIVITVMGDPIASENLKVLKSSKLLKFLCTLGPKVNGGGLFLNIIPSDA